MLPGDILFNDTEYQRMLSGMKQKSLETFEKKTGKVNNEIKKRSEENGKHEKHIWK